MSLGLIFFGTLAINLFMVGSTHASIFNRIDKLPDSDAAILMGTDLVRSDGSTNVHFINRTDAAAKLFLAGKVKRLLISGNPNNKKFNEVLEMQKVLLDRGIPENAIALDSGGIRTWETARRANRVYHIQNAIIVTDNFHAYRSLFLCRHFGIEAVAFCSVEEPANYWFWRHRIREYFARVKAVWDIAFKDPDPR